MRLGIVAALLVVLFTGAAMAGEAGPRAAPTTIVSVGTLAPTPSPQAGFDALKSTNAYLAEVSGAAALVWLRLLSVPGIRPRLGAGAGGKVNVKTSSLARP